ncbi:MULTISPECIES: FAD-dependent oxidoreductase [unclassified Caballeronia]|uniref:FAD-dependent oxidoreductase n=1 Tax=unclassified Caballeronia TaxID=2646786 RepID=UPI0020288D5F|nr:MULTISPECIES: FAD-dependent oxidoreductase [unclassified Caballeronia]
MTKRTNGLALLAHKCAARTFDLSTGVVHASMRDQIVRAQLLIRDLRENDPTCNRVLIVGGGVGGVSAATMACELDMDVVLVDSQNKPFSLQAGVTSRFVGPFMYEWPELGHDCQDYPPPGALGQPSDATPKWTAAHPIPAAKFAENLDDWLVAHRFLPGTARFYFGVVPAEVEAYVRAFVAYHGTETVAGVPPGPEYVLPKGCLDHQGKPAHGGTSFRPDYIVLAAGMGEERVALPGFPRIRGKSFWDNDELKLDKTRHANSCVFGGGDGALQDVLRLLTKHDHPLQLIRDLRLDTAVAEAIDRWAPSLEALERQSRLVTTWSGTGSFEDIDTRCQSVAAALAGEAVVREAVRRQLREGRGEVHHVMRERCFGKAYLLNRFVVHLIEQCQKLGAYRRVLTYRVHREASITDARPTVRDGKRGFFISLEDDPKHYFFRWIAVRYGADSDTVPQSKMVKLNPKTRADRTSMAAIPLPLMVPD